MKFVSLALTLPGSLSAPIVYLSDINVLVTLFVEILSGQDPSSSLPSLHPFHLLLFWELNSLVVTDKKNGKITS
jgi:hypothetical protein